MNNFRLKLLACIFMFIDHLGFIIHPEIIWLRIIGRLSFPIFAFLLTEGYLHTRNIKKYLLRLFMFAILPQIAYSIAFETDVLNIFFTLFFGMLAVLADDKIKNPYAKWVTILSVIAISELIPMDYGYYGIVTIFLFKKFKNDRKKLLVTFFLLNLSIYFRWDIQVFAVFSLPIIWTYNKQIGYNNIWVKYFFYFFYFLHIVAIYLVNEYFFKA